MTTDINTAIIELANSIRVNETVDNPSIKEIKDFTKDNRLWKSKIKSKKRCRRNLKITSLKL